METLEFSQYRPRFCTVHAALFREASNAADLIYLLKSKGAEAFPLQMALIDAAYIVSREHLLVAVNQALISQNRGGTNPDHPREKGKDVGAGAASAGGTRGLKTKSIHSEVLWNLSISSNIMESFKTFGVSDKTKDIIAVHIGDEDSPEPEEILSQIAAIIHGALEQDGLQALDDWKVMGNDAKQQPSRSPVDWTKVKKVYKVDSVTDKDKTESLVVSMVAMKRVAA